MRIGVVIWIFIDYYKFLKKNIRIIFNLQTKNILRLKRFFKAYKKYIYLKNFERKSINDNKKTLHFDDNYFY